MCSIRQSLSKETCFYFSSIIECRLTTTLNKCQIYKIIYLFAKVNFENVLLPAFADFILLPRQNYNICLLFFTFATKMS